MMRSLFILLILAPQLLFSQLGSVRFEANAGANYTLLKYENVDFERRLNPYVGSSALVSITDMFGMKISTLYSIRGSQSISPYFWHRNSYMEFKLLPQFRAGSFLEINLGVAYSLLLNSSLVTLDGGSTSGKRRDPLVGYDSEVHPVIGFDLHLDERLILGINYFIPVTKTHSSNLQFGVQIPLNF